MAWEVQGNLKGPPGDDGADATVSVGTVTTGSAGSEAQVTNSGSPSAAVFNFVIPKGDKGEDGAGIAIGGSVDDYSDLAAIASGLDTDDAGKGWLVRADGDLYIWDGTSFPSEGEGTEFQGPPGAAATVAVGTVTTGNAGTSASVTNSGTSAAAVFNFIIPRGDTGADGNDGNDGAAATIAVGTVTTGDAGTSATVTNSGTSSAAVFNFTIPKGADGADGTDGTDGTKWFNGTGAPGTIAGAIAGDYYIDTDSGDLYLLS